MLDLTWLLCTSSYCVSLWLVPSSTSINDYSRSQSLKLPGPLPPSSFSAGDLVPSCTRPIEALRYDLSLLQGSKSTNLSLSKPKLTFSPVSKNSMASNLFSTCLCPHGSSGNVCSYVKIILPPTSVFSTSLSQLALI